MYLFQPSNNMDKLENENGLFKKLRVRSAGISAVVNEDKNIVILGILILSYWVT